MMNQFNKNSDNSKVTYLGFNVLTKYLQKDIMENYISGVICVQIILENRKTVVK